MYRAPLVVALFSIALLPVIFLPGSSILPETIKGIVPAFVFGAAMLFVGARTMLGRYESISLPRALLFTLPYLIVIGASALASGVSKEGWWGVVMDPGSFGFYALFLIVMCAASWAPFEFERKILVVFCGAVLFAGVVAGVAFYIFDGSGVFTILSGEWPQLSFLLGAAVFSYAIIRYNHRGLTKGYSHIFIISGCVLGLFLFPYTPVFGALIFSLGFLSVHAFGTGDQNKIALRTFSVFWALIFTISILIFARGGIANNLPTEVHPTLLLTELIAVPALSENARTFFLGIGPLNFDQAWLLHYPPEINQTSLWNEVFSSGQSFLLTRVVEMGMLGILAIIALISVAIRFLRENSLYVAAFVYFIVSALFFSVGAPFILWGALIIGLLSRNEHFNIQLKNQHVVQGIGILGIFIGALFLVISGVQMVALYTYERGVALYEAGNKMAAAVSFEVAVERWAIPLYAQTSARTMLEVALSSSDISPAQQQELLGRSVARIEQAILLAPRDFNSWLIRSSMYVSLVSVGSIESENLARESIAQAKSIAPNRPDPYYLEAVLEKDLGNLSAARAAALRALHLKNDYLEAHQLLETL